MVLMKIAQRRRWVCLLKVDLKEVSMSRMKWNEVQIKMKFKSKYSISLSITEWIVNVLDGVCDGRRYVVVGEITAS